MAEEKVEVALAVSGEAVVGRALDNTASKLEGVTKATKQVAEASQATARATASVTAATEAASSATVRATAGFAKFGPTLGIVAQGMSTMGGATGQVTQVLGAASGAVAGLTTAFGPLGLALGAIGAAFTVYQRIVAAAREETEQLAQSQRDALEFSRQYADAMSTEGRIRRAQQQNQLNADRNRLLGSEEGLLVRIQDLTEQIASARASDDRAWFAGALERRRDQLRAELAELRAERDAQTRPARGGGAKEPARGGARRQPERESLSGMFRDIQQGQGQLEGEQLGTIDVAEEEFLEAAQRKADAVGMQTKATDELTAAQERANAQQLLFLDGINASIESAGRYAGIVGGAVIGAISAAIKGEMSLGKAIKQVVGERLEALAIEESILAIAATAKAIGASVWNPAAAAGFWAEAASHAKAAVAAGAGAAILGGGGGGGGGGSSSAAPAAAPTRDTSSAAPADQSRNITVYFGSPVVTATTVAELGREIKSAILTADARYGA